MKNVNVSSSKKVYKIEKYQGLILNRKISSINSTRYHWDWILSSQCFDK